MIVIIDFKIPTFHSPILNKQLLSVESDETEQTDTLEQEESLSHEEKNFIYIEFFRKIHKQIIIRVTLE